MNGARSRTTRVADTTRRLREDRDAWVASAGPGRPWLVPLSFVWFGVDLLLCTSRDSPVVKDLTVAPAVRVALGHTRDVVMIQGTAEIHPIDTLADAELQAYVDKLSSDPRDWADAVIRVRPDTVLAWRQENEVEGRIIMRDGTWLA